jgi:hypothetical protein
VRSQLRILSISAMALIVCGLARAQEKYLHISVVDPRGKPIQLVELTTSGKSSTSVTDSNGKVTLRLAPETDSNIEVELVIGSAPKDMVFISPWDGRVRVPPFGDASQNVVKIVLDERGNRRMLEDPEARRAMATTIIYIGSPGLALGQSPEARREAALAETSRLFGLPSDEIVRAILDLGEKAKDPFDKAQADFIAKNYAKASEGFAQASEILQAELEEATGKLFDARSFHGQSLFNEGKYHQSVEAFLKALKLRKDDEATLNNIGVSLTADGKYADALPYLEQALTIHEKALGANHPDTATSLNNLALLYQSQGKYGEAEPLFKRALAISEKARGGRSSLHRHETGQLGGTLQIAGEVRRSGAAL